MIKDGDTDLEICPCCGQELVVRSAEVTKLNDADDTIIYGMVYPVHFAKVAESATCETSGQLVDEKLREKYKAQP